MLHKIVIAGGNGFLGKSLMDYFNGKCRHMVVLARRDFQTDYQNATVRVWDARTPGSWCSDLEGADLLINLVGKNVNCRYTDENKRQILSSRLDSTAVLGEAVRSCKTPPRVWMNSSSATIYNASYDKMQTEQSGDIGDDFSMSVCKKWEEEFSRNSDDRIRKVILRTGIVLGKDGGAFPTLLRLTKLGLGGHQGDGKQYCSWIHVKDFCAAVEFILKAHDTAGVYNITSPKPVPNAAFMKALQSASGQLIGLPAPRFLLELGAVFIRTETELVLKSRKVYPKRLLDEGFVFEFEEVNDAFQNLCQ